MAGVLYTLDGKAHVIFEESSVEDLIREYMGDDVRQYIKDVITDLKKQSEEYQTDNDLLAAELDKFARELKDDVECLQEMFNKPKIKRTEVKRVLDRMYNFILSEI